MIGRKRNRIGVESTMKEAGKEGKVRNDLNFGGFICRYTGTFSSGSTIVVSIILGPLRSKGIIGKLKARGTQVGQLRLSESGKRDSSRRR